MLIFNSFPLQTPASFKGHPVTCRRCPFLIRIGISNSTRVDLGITIVGCACGIIISSVPGLEINYMVTLKSSSILPTLRLSLVVTYCLIVLPSPTSCHPPWGH